MYVAENIYTKEKYIFKNTYEVAKRIKVTSPHVSRLIKSKKTTKIGWRVEKVSKKEE